MSKISNPFLSKVLSMIQELLNKCELDHQDPHVAMLVCADLISQIICNIAEPKQAGELIRQIEKHINNTVEENYCALINKKNGNIY